MPLTVMEIKTILFETSFSDIPLTAVSSFIHITSLCSVLIWNRITLLILRASHNDCGAFLWSTFCLIHNDDTRAAQSR
jgi:hypothetical protein